ncbi:molybdate ABC transporter substrate-binding protein [Radicibacter daui]|uniref:molybdate ABC transporter substrate-binding protein n=1 Tax=Radicibacter daui TaxID=3064829 RepID=UPI004047042B
MFTPRRLLLIAAATLAFSAGSNPAQADDITVAVAANFNEPLKALAPLFEKAEGHHITIVSGSSGQLVTQIGQGAPFDVFLSADQERPQKLEETDGGVKGTRFTYALGTLTLWSADAGLIGSDGAATLKDGKFLHIAIANPKLAPYGLAASQVMAKLGVAEALKDKIVTTENIGQTFTTVSTGNAELGFVALSSVMSPGAASKGSRWDPPADLYDPIKQDAILLTRAKDNAGARAFLTWLKGDEARKVIRSYGYGDGD